MSSSCSSKLSSSFIDMVLSIICCLKSCSSVISSIISSSSISSSIRSFSSKSLVSSGSVVISSFKVFWLQVVEVWQSSSSISRSGSIRLLILVLVLLLISSSCCCCRDSKISLKFWVLFSFSKTAVSGNFVMVLNETSVLLLLGFIFNNSQKVFKFSEKKLFYWIIFFIGFFYKLK